MVASEKPHELSPDVLPACFVLHLIKIGVLGHFLYLDPLVGVELDDPAEQVHESLILDEQKVLS